MWIKNENTASELHMRYKTEQWCLCQGKLIDYVGIDGKTGRYLTSIHERATSSCPLAIPFRHKIGPIIVKFTFQKMIIQRSRNCIQPVTFRMVLSVGDVSHRAGITRGQLCDWNTVWSATGRYTTL